MTTPALTVAQFRDIFSEFEDSSTYLDEWLQPWLDFAIASLPPARWRSLWTMGVCLYTAHQIALQRQLQLQARRGGAPGLGYGVISSKSVNGVSVGYNTSLAQLNNAGDFALTIYGIRFLTMARMIGSGGAIVVGGDAQAVSDGTLMSGSFNSGVA